MVALEYGDHKSPSNFVENGSYYREILEFDNSTNFWRTMNNWIVVCTLIFAKVGAAYAQQDTAAVDSALLRQVEKAMQINSPTQEAGSGAQARSGLSTNPNIGVVGDFQSSYRTRAARNFNAYLNEGEFSFQSVVDPYARADFFLALAKDPATNKFEAEIEEAYVTTLELPAKLQLKAGKFRMAMGKVNPIHPHALPFVDMPNVLVNYLGDDGLNDEGFSLSWLVPNPLDFYQEITFELTSGPADNPSFARSQSNQYLYLGHLKNFWDLTSNATFEFGFTGIHGANDSSFTTSIGAVDVTYKWKPVRYNTYRSFVWQTEVLLSRAKLVKTGVVKTWGMYSAATYQLSRRYFLTGRFDYSNQPSSRKIVERAYSATLGWYATEFQKIELEGKINANKNEHQYYQALLRWIFVIGAHGAHAY